MSRLHTQSSQWEINALVIDRFAVGTYDCEACCSSYIRLSEILYFTEAGAGAHCVPQWYYMLVAYRIVYSTLQKLLAYNSTCLYGCREGQSSAKLSYRCQRSRDLPGLVRNCAVTPYIHKRKAFMRNFSQFEIQVQTGAITIRFGVKKPVLCATCARQSSLPDGSVVI